ncbi:gonadotropin-releasing hormone receptor isoform X1 [Ixodes scapularis]
MCGLFFTLCQVTTRQGITVGSHSACRRAVAGWLFASPARRSPSRGENGKCCSEGPPILLLSGYGGTVRDHGSRNVISECKQHSSLSQRSAAAGMGLYLTGELYYCA